MSNDNFTFDKDALPTENTAVGNAVYFIDGAIYRDMIVSGANALDNDRERINDLNVFPVPDGDTGINMSLTMSPARTDTASFKGSLSEVSGAFAKAFLRSARGNSGVILSSFFRGISRCFRDCKEADARKTVEAMRQGVDAAYKAVMTPTEGTILTVMRVSVEKAEALFSESSETEWKGELTELLEYMLKVANETLDETPEMLPALKQANVVDAGGSGFVAVLGGMLSALKGEPVDSLGGDDDNSAERNGAADFSQFDTESITFPYCTECIVTTSEDFVEEGSCEALHEFVMSIGDSVVFVEDTDIIKVHVHTDDPGRVLSEAIKYGSLYTVKIENMRNQHTAILENADTDGSVKNNAEPVSAEPIKPYGFVSVCSGDGLRAVFTDLGADRLVTGGQTMNPSTEDMLSAIAATPAETVFVFPNNSNIYLVAKTAAEMTQDKRVEVIRTVSVPQGFAAMLAFDESATPEENREAMEAAVAATVTASMTYAAHDSTFDGKKIHLGQLLGLVENKVKYVTDSRDECILQLAESVKKCDIITLYYGEDISREEAEKAAELLSTRVNPYAEISVIEGGQPVYFYIVSGENA